MLQELLNTGKVWRASGTDIPWSSEYPSGFTKLDERLQSNGWPNGGVIEILHEQHGIGELNLLMPLVARLSQDEHYCAWIAPPYRIQALALIQHHISLPHQLIIEPDTNRDLLWSLEECIRSHAVKLILAWTGSLRGEQVRRLQLLASEHQVCCFLFLVQGSENTPCSLRLHLNPLDHETLQIAILRQKSGITDTAAFPLTHRQISHFTYCHEPHSADD